MNRKLFIVLVVLIGLLTWWVSNQLAAPAMQNEYREATQERARITKKMKYHGLNGVVMLRESPRGWEFERDGQWCKL